MRHFPTKSFQKGQYIVIKGSKAQFHEFYLIEEGEAEMKTLDKKFILTKGRFINLLSALTEKTTALTTVKAVSNVKVICLSISNLLQYKSITKDIMLGISKELNIYFSQLYAKGADLVKKTKKDPKYLIFELGLYLNLENLFKRSHYTFSKFLEYYPNDDLSEEVKKYMLQMEEYSVKERKKVDKYAIYTKNEVVYTQFEKADRMYFLNEGTLKFFYFCGKKEYYMEALKAKTIFGNMLAGSDLRDFSCVVDSKEAHILSFPVEKFKGFMTNQKNEILLNIIQNLAERIWKTYMRIEHMLKFRNQNIELSVQIYDLLHSFYETNSNDDQEFFNFGIKPEELLKSTNFSKEFKLENLIYIIENTPFLSFDKDNNVTCKDILALKASCYKAKQNFLDQ